MKFILNIHSIKVYKALLWLFIVFLKSQFSFSQESSKRTYVNDLSLIAQAGIMPFGLNTKDYPAYSWVSQCYKAEVNIYENLGVFADYIITNPYRFASGVVNYGVPSFRKFDYYYEYYIKATVFNFGFYGSIPIYKKLYLTGYLGVAHISTDLAMYQTNVNTLNVQTTEETFSDFSVVLGGSFRYPIWQNFHVALDLSLSEMSPVSRLGLTYKLSLK